MALVHGEGQDRWYFSKEELQRTPSVLSGIDSAKELSYRQQSANLIQDMGQRLVVSQLTINTAIVYMHRFYMFHSFSDMNRNDIAPCCLFLSAKLEEQPRKLEHVIKVANICLQKNDNVDQKSEAFQQQSQDLVINESILLQTLGFELTVDHPHTHVVKITQLVRASKDLAQTSYFMATNSLHLTPFCIQHKPSVVACVCIHLACKWSNWEFPRSSDNKDWWEYVDPNVTKETLDTICQEFLTIIENCPSRLKRRINNVTIYKGGHRTKPSEKSSGNSTSTNGDASKVKGKSPHKEGSSTKREQSSSEISKVEHVITTETPSNPSTERPNDVISSNNNSTSTVRITENAAVVETPTSTVMLPALQPLTTKYANMPGLSSNSTEHQSKSSNVHQKGPSVNKNKTIPGVKHKHREHDESDSPAKKLKTISSISSHSSQAKHLQRPSSQSKHSFHHTSSKPSSHAMSSLHHKAHLKSGSSGQHHNNFSPKVINKNASHAQHSGSPKLPVRSSSSQGSSAVHHSSSKRQNHSGVPQSSHLHHRSNGNRALMPSSNKHSGSPGLVKKLSEDRHKRPPSASSRPKPEITGFGTSSGFRSSEMDKGKKYSGEEFFSPPGPQRMPSLPTMPPMNFEKLRSNNAPPLPSTDQTNPPPPPLPSNHPPSPPPPPT